MHQIKQHLLQNKKKFQMFNCYNLHIAVLKIILNKVINNALFQQSLIVVPGLMSINAIKRPYFSSWKTGKHFK